MNQQGPTLADTRGLKRVRKLGDTRLNIWLAILAAQDKVACIDHEIEELMLQAAADRVRALVDRPDLGELRKEEWL
jgi:hypothetical protein